MAAAFSVHVFSAQAQTTWLWPIKGQEAGQGVICTPQQYVGEEFNFGNLIVAAPEGTDVLCPADGVVLNFGVGSLPMEWCSISESDMKNRFMNPSPFMPARIISTQCSESLKRPGSSRICPFRPNMWEGWLVGGSRESYQAGRRRRDDFYKDMFARCPAGRPGTADEVANVAELLMSKQGAFITGSDFLMDGGATAAYFYGE